MSDPKAAALTVETIDGRLVISIGVECLASAIERGAECEDDGLRITNPEMFARELAIMLEQEDEGGATRVQDMLDMAARAVVEQGLARLAP